MKEVSKWGRCGAETVCLYVRLEDAYICPGSPLKLNNLLPRECRLWLFIKRR